MFVAIVYAVVATLTVLPFARSIAAWSGDIDDASDARGDAIAAAVIGLLSAAVWPVSVIVLFVASRLSRHP